jgi:hypothetical protein
MIRLDAGDFSPPAVIFLLILFDMLQPYLFFIPFQTFLQNSYTALIPYKCFFEREVYLD